MLVNLVLSSGDFIKKKETINEQLRKILISKDSNKNTFN